MTDCCAPNIQPGNAFDLAVVGAGSAGFSAAITAAEQGARVALVGSGTIGGTCVNVGCVPSKTMIRAAEALHGARIASRFPGLRGEARIESWHQVVSAKNDLVSTLRQKKYADLLPAYGNIEYLEGAARLAGSDVVIDGHKIVTGRTIIATGGRPSEPSVPGLDGIGYLTSTTLMDMQELPESLIVMGGGYIGSELAQMMSRLGVVVTLICRSRLLPDAEPEISEALTDAFRHEGVTVHTGVDYLDCREEDACVVVRILQGEATVPVRAEQLLVAAGRMPNTESLGLAEAGVETDQRGAILIDEHMRTSRSGIYAAGDATNRDQFVYMAAYGGKLAALNALNGDSLAYDNCAMPWVVFTDPQVAGAGLSEAAAIATGRKVKTSVLPLESVPRALAARDTRGLIKLVADAETDLLLGGQILAPEGADSIQTLALALKFNMTTKALGETLFPYLTTVEGLKLAAQTFDKDVSKLSCCAG